MYNQLFLGGIKKYRETPTPLDELVLFKVVVHNVTHNRKWCDVRLMKPVGRNCVNRAASPPLSLLPFCSGGAVCSRGSYCLTQTRLTARTVDRCRELSWGSSLQIQIKSFFPYEPPMFLLYVCQNKALSGLHTGFIVIAHSILWGLGMLETGQSAYVGCRNENSFSDELASWQTRVGRVASGFPYRLSLPFCCGP